MVAREPCAGRANTAAQSRQTAEYRLQDFFMEWNAGLRDLFYATRRRADSFDHNEHVGRIRSRVQSTAKSRARRPMGNRNVARGQDDLHARVGRIARSAPGLSPVNIDRTCREDSRLVLPFLSSQRKGNKLLCKFICRLGCAAWDLAAGQSPGALSTKWHCQEFPQCEFVLLAIRRNTDGNGVLRHVAA